jgi:predicted dehydrogenase
MVANRPVGLGLIGCGAFGQFCLNAFASLPEVNVAAVADVRKDAADRLADAFGVPGHYNPVELISRDDVEVVHVATPPSSHRALVLRAAAEGKHVLCEKPLAMSLAEADEMLAAVAEAGTVCAVNFVLRHNAVTDAVKSAIDSGVLGQVLSARVTNCASDSFLPPGHWFWDKSVSGGIFVEHGVHFFDLYRYWLGPGQVIEAHAEVRPGTGQEDRVTCTVAHTPSGNRPSAIASHYHGFDQTIMLDRADHRLVCELGDIRVAGWIPLTLTVDAVLDDDASDRLAARCPWDSLDVLERYPPQRRSFRSRGRQRTLTQRLRLRYTPDADKQAVYADSVRALLADQLAYIRDPSHRRVITEANGRDSLALAEAAVRLAAG